MIQKPSELGAGEIGIRNQTGFFTNQIPAAPGNQFIHQMAGATALPDNGVGHTFTGFPVPEEGGLQLIGNANCGNVRRIHTGKAHRFPQRRNLAVQNIPGIMFHPAGLRIVLGKFFIKGGDLLPIFRKNHRTGAGGSLIQRYQIPFHVPYSFLSVPSVRRSIA